MPQLRPADTHPCGQRWRRLRGSPVTEELSATAPGRRAPRCCSGEPFTRFPPPTHADCSPPGYRRRHGLKRRPPAHVEVIVMTTTNQRPRQSGLSTPIRRALTRSLRAVRDVHREQVYAWEAFWRSCRAPQGPRRPAPRHTAPMRWLTPTPLHRPIWARVIWQPDLSRARPRHSGMPSVRRQWASRGLAVRSVTPATSTLPASA